MYIPTHFEPPDAEAVRALLSGHGAADLVTLTEQGLLATMLPLIFLPPELAGPDRPLGAMLGHVARTNDQWRLGAVGEALAIVRGPDAYVSPSWYATKAEHGRVVPTWNYITAHVYGRLVVHDDLRWVEDLVRELTAKHENARPVPWSVDDAPQAYLSGQLRAIVGLELVISRVEAKFKLSQNRSAADIAGVVAGLTDEGQVDLATSSERVNARKLTTRGG